MRKLGIRQWIVHKLGGVMLNEMKMTKTAGPQSFRCLQLQKVTAEQEYYYDASDEDKNKKIRLKAEAQAAAKIIGGMRKNGWIKFHHENKNQGLNEKYRIASVRAELSVVVTEDEEHEQENK